MEYTKLVIVGDLDFIELENLHITHWQLSEIIPINQGCRVDFIQLLNQNKIHFIARTSKELWSCNSLPGITLQEPIRVINILK